jgi:flagellar biogenesis protein FliO
MQSFDWGQFIASTFSVLLLLVGALWWVKRQRGFSAHGSEEKRIQVLETLPLSLKHKMVLIQVDNQIMLTSVSPAEVRTLHAWTEEVRHAA